MNEEIEKILHLLEISYSSDCELILGGTQTQILHNYITKLQNNWNELKKLVIEQEQKAWDEVSSTFDYVLNKMQELEKGKDE